MDRYARVVLTVIALCLLWLCSRWPPVEAQGPPARVVVAGWVDSNDEVHLLGPASAVLPGRRTDYRYVDPLPVTK